MSDISELEELKNIVRYYRMNRGVGHTTAMLYGALEVDNALVLTHNEMFAKDLKQYSKGKGTQFISPHKSYEKLQGQRRPLVVDHHHLCNLIEAALTQALEKQKEELLDWCEREVVGAAENPKRHTGFENAVINQNDLRQHQRQIIQKKRKGLIDG